MYWSIFTIPLTYSLVALIVFYVVSLFLGNYIEMSWKNTLIVVSIVFISYFSILVYLKKKGFTISQIYGEQCIHNSSESLDNSTVHSPEGSAGTFGFIPPVSETLSN